MSQQLTVIIPCKNESRNIRFCIESVREVADEILVADSGSTDDTVRIARELGGCRIVEREWIDATDFKNWAIAQASHDWIMVVDADERVTPELAQEIRHVLNQPRHNGYLIYRANHFMGHRVRYGQWGADKILRLFHRSHGRYVGDNDHASVRLSSGRAGYLRNRLIHFTFWTYDQYLRKVHHYATMQAENWYRARKKPNLLRLYLTVPVRFLQTYVLRRGFLDGSVGFQVCMMIAYYSLLKQVRLWELWHVQPSPAGEPSRIAEKALSAVDRMNKAHDTCWTFNQYIARSELDAAHQAQLWFEAGQSPPWWRIYLTAPLRFLHNYLLRLGFLDGTVGFQMSALKAFGAFQKQARLWELHFAHQQPAPEREREQEALTSSSVNSSCSEAA